MQQIRLAVRQLVEFLLQTGDIDSRFAGFDRANEGARIHRRLQKQAGEGYQPEVFLSGSREVDGIRCTVEGRADGIFTDGSGCPVIDEIKTTGVPSAEIHDGLNPCHWAQGMVYAALYTAQQGLAGASVRLTYYQIDDDKIFYFTRRFSSAELEDFLLGLRRQYAPWARRQLDWSAARTASLQAMRFPYDGYRPGQRALAGEKKYQDYYTFKEGSPDQPPTNWVSKFGGPAWEYLPALGKWYLHLFDVSQADLNWENPAVRAELAAILRFWKGKGIKGFRFDVVNLISKPAVFEDDPQGDGRRFYTDGRNVHRYLQELVAAGGIEGMITVGEMSSTTLENCIGYTDPARHELTMTFSFHHLKVDYKNGDKWALMPPDHMALKNLFTLWQEGMQAGHGWNALFWCNHDQPRAVSRFGDDGGPCWKQSAKMLGTAIHMMRGPPYIYQGEELGMTNAHFASIGQYRDVESLNYYQILQQQGKTPAQAMEIIQQRSRDNGRTPMQWDASAHAGFTTGTPWIGVVDNYRTINAAAEVGDPDSIYRYYKQLVALRKQRPVIQSGRIEFLYKDDPDLLAYRRWDETGELLVLCNLTAHDAPVALPQGWQNAGVLLGNYPDGAPGASLRPYEALVLERRV